MDVSTLFINFYIVSWSVSQCGMNKHDFGTNLGPDVCCR